MSDVLPRYQVEDFERDGVVSQENVLSGAEVVRYRMEVRRLLDGISPELRSIQFGQAHLYFRWAYQLVRHPRILKIIEPLIGPDILAHSSTIFYKAPRDPGFVSWHQDGYYWGLEPPELVSAWVALTDSTRANGCLRAVVGSHELVGPPLFSLGLPARSSSPDSQDYRAPDRARHPGSLQHHLLQGAA